MRCGGGEVRGGVAHVALLFSLYRLGFHGWAWCESEVVRVWLWSLEDPGLFVVSVMAGGCLWFSASMLLAG